jgi:hypothetical protein
MQAIRDVALMCHNPSRSNFSPLWHPAETKASNTGFGFDVRYYQQDRKRPPRIPSGGFFFEDE